MYDCLAPEHHPVTPSFTQPRALKSPLPAPIRACLSLRAPAGSASLQLNQAFAAATSLGWPVAQRDCGRIDVFDLTLADALLIARRFPALLLRYEPARPWLRAA